MGCMRKEGIEHIIQKDFNYRKVNITHVVIGDRKYRVKDVMFVIYEKDK